MNILAGKTQLWISMFQISNGSLGVSDLFVHIVGVGSELFVETVSTFTIIWHRIVVERYNNVFLSS